MLTLILCAVAGWLLAVIANKLLLDKNPIKKSSLIIVLGLVAIALISIFILIGLSPNVAGANVGVFVVILYSIANKAEKVSTENSS